MACNLSGETLQIGLDEFSCWIYTPAACRGGEIGRRRGFKIPRWQHCAGSSPALGTILTFS